MQALFYCIYADLRLHSCKFHMFTVNNLQIIMIK